MATSPPATCYCGSSHGNHLSCRVCAARNLTSKIARYSAAKQRHLQKKRECQLRLLETRLLPANEIDDGGDDKHNLQNDIDGVSLGKSKRRPLPDPNQINQQVTHLKERLDILRSLSNDLAVNVTAKTMENDERQSNLEIQSQKVLVAQERLSSMKHCLVFQAEENIINSPDEKKLYGNDSVGDGRLRDALDHGRHQIQSLRFQFALRVFDMHRIDVGEEYANGNKGKMNKDNATGVGKIGGLPLPHAGPALYGVLPQGVLASSLRLVATLTNLVSRCLGVVLPHPILVCAKECSKCGSVYNFGGDVIDTISFDDIDIDIDDGFGDDAQSSLCNACCQEGSSSSPRKNQRGSGASGSQSKVIHAKLPSPNTTRLSKTSLMSFVGTSARKAMALTASATSRAMTNTQHVATSSEQGKSSQLISTSPSIVTKRINHASFAVLAESYQLGATEYILNPPRLNDDGGNNEGKILSSVNETGASSSNSQNQLFSNREDFHSAEERFSIGVQLLQNDVIALCFRAGVDVSKLWPAESVLLNLHALLEHCQAQIV